MPVSLKDVASAAGVSIKTVSNVVHDYPFVRPTTRARVQKALDDLGYRPNFSARRLRNGRSGLIALSLPELAPYFSELAELVVEAAEERGLTVLLDRSGGERTHERRVAGGIRSNLTDGTIASPLAMTAEDVDRLRDSHPIVLLGERLSHVGVDHVAIDSVSAARTATEHLLDLGRRSVAALGTARHPAGTVALRQRGYEQALRGRRIRVDRGLYADVELFHRSDGYEATRRLLAARPDVDAIFCFNDLLAFGALRALREARCRVPDDVAVVGFDDVEECTYCNPPLTSIAPDKAAVAEAAVSLLLQRMRSEQPIEPREVFPPYRLVVRESTAGKAR
jgi:DNA-binding LacI/PurR family transcriptional regulator